MNLVLKTFVRQSDLQAHASAAAFHRELKRRLGQAREQAETAPSPGQIEAGNYAKGHVSLHGLDITIENPRGSVRSAVDGSWSRRMPYDYGYFKRTEGSDGDAVDVFIGDHPGSELVFVVDQVDRDGRFDEHKVILGTLTEAEARQVYTSAYPAGWRVGPITALTIEQFKTWLRDGDTTKRLAPRVKLVIKAIRNNPRNYLGLDRVGRIHWKRLPRNSPDALFFGTARAERTASTFAEARDAASVFINTALKNDQTGLVAAVSGTTLGKMLQNKAVSKSESTEAHAHAVANLDGLFPRALLGWSKPDRKRDKNLVAIHRFFSPILFKRSVLLAKLTVKQTVSDKDPNPIYSVEAVELSDKVPAAEWVAATAQSDGIDPTSTRSAGTIVRLAKRVEAFNRRAASARKSGVARP